MMKGTTVNVQVVTDSVASLPADIVEELDITVVSLYILENGVSYVDDQLDVDEYYKNIAEKVENIPTSSQPSQDDFIKVFSKAAEAKRDVVGVFISEKMSGTVEGALRAARDVKKHYPQWSCSVVNSTSNSFDEGFGVIAAAKLAQEGKDVHSCAEAAMESNRSSRFLFAPESLTFLRAGGRIGRASALLGALLNIHLVLTVRNELTDTYIKVRSQAKALAAIVEKFETDIASHGLKDVVVHYIGSALPATEWARKRIEPLVGHAVRVVPVSPVVGVHTGPAIGICYECTSVLPDKITFAPDTLITNV